QLTAYLRSYHLYLAHAKVAGIEILLQAFQHRVRNHALQIVDVPQHAALQVVAHVQNVACHPLVLRRAGMRRIPGDQRIANRGKADHIIIVDVSFALDWIRLQRVDDLFLAPIKVGLAGLLDVQLDHHLVGRCHVVALDDGVMESALVQLAADGVDIRRVSELYIHYRPAPEFDAQRNLVPEEHGENAGHTEDQRKAEEVPFLAQEIDVGIAKKFHFVLTFALYAERLAASFAAEHGIENYAGDEDRGKQVGQKAEDQR